MLKNLAYMLEGGQLTCMHGGSDSGSDMAHCALPASAGKPRHLQRGAEGLVGKPNSAELRGGLTLAQPRTPLPLWVNQDGEARGARDQDAVLHAEVVCRQSLPGAGSRTGCHTAEGVCLVHSACAVGVYVRPTQLETV